jgi:hypothetical protein
MAFFFRVLARAFLLQIVGMTNSPGSSESWLRGGALPFEHEHEQEHEQALSVCLPEGFPVDHFAPACS